MHVCAHTHTHTRTHTHTHTHMHTHTHTCAHRSAIHSTVTYLVLRGKRMGPGGDLNDAMDNGRRLFQRNDA